MRAGLARASPPPLSNAVPCAGSRETSVRVTHDLRPVSLLEPETKPVKRGEGKFYLCKSAHKKTFVGGAGTYEGA